tara:strand:+ start:140 stop:409 length:270 start_codon:yes stop_codon:yes gene_type:complete
MVYSQHCIKRCQQRGISKPVIDFIICHGSFINSHHDRKYFINKSKLKALFYKHKCFILKNDKQILSTSVIVNGDVVITAMKKTKQVRWN